MSSENGNSTESMVTKGYRLSSIDIERLDSLAARMNKTPSWVLREMIGIVHHLSASERLTEFFYTLSKMDSFNLAKKELTVPQEEDHANCVIREEEQGNPVIRTPENVRQETSK